MRALGVLCVLVLWAVPAMAQHQHGGTTEARELYPGLGTYHHPITTSSSRRPGKMPRCNCVSKACRAWQGCRL
jgi:hypothetical protein